MLGVRVGEARRLGERVGEACRLADEVALPRLRVGEARRLADLVATRDFVTVLVGEMGRTAGEGVAEVTLKGERDETREADGSCDVVREIENDDEHEAVRACEGEIDEVGESFERSALEVSDTEEDGEGVPDPEEVVQPLADTRAEGESVSVALVHSDAEMESECVPDPEIVAESQALGEGDAVTTAESESVAVALVHCDAEKEREAVSVPEDVDVTQSLGEGSAVEETVGVNDGEGESLLDGDCDTVSDAVGVEGKEGEGGGEKVARVV